MLDLWRQVRSQGLAGDFGQAVVDRCFASGDRQRSATLAAGFKTIFTCTGSLVVVAGNASVRSRPFGARADPADPAAPAAPPRPAAATRRRHLSCLPKHKEMDGNEAGAPEAFHDLPSSSSGLQCPLGYPCAGCNAALQHPNALGDPDPARDRWRPLPSSRNQQACRPPAPSPTSQPGE